MADIIVVGAGIIGLAHAYEAARQGHKVTVFERDTRAVGASIRNFGLIWPIGQPAGALFERALRSRETWLQVSERADLWCVENGSLHLAYHDDELAVIEEYAAGTDAEQYALLTPAQVAEHSPAAKREGLLGALWSQTELTVDPRQALRILPGWLEHAYQVDVRFGETVREISLPHVHTTKGLYQADHVFVCSGTDFETLYPTAYAESGIIRCKLQMQRTIPQPAGWTLGPSLCAGLTLLHYKAFAHCDSLASLRARIEAEMPFYVEQGIHVLLSQTAKGELTIGDHHEYGTSFDPFEREDVDKAIRDYLLTFANAPTLKIAERWHGVYPLVEGRSELILQPESGVTIVNGLGGAGMTQSFGLAQETIKAI